MATIPFRQRFSATIAECTEGTGVGRTVLYELIKSGRVSTRKMGARTMVIVSSLIRAIDPAEHDDTAKAA